MRQLIAISAKTGWSGRRIGSHCEAGAHRRRVAGEPAPGIDFRSWFDPYRGVIVLVRVFFGREPAERAENTALVELEGSGDGNLGVLTPKPWKWIRGSREVGFRMAKQQTVATRRLATRSRRKTIRARAVARSFEDLSPWSSPSLYTVESHEHTR